MEETHVKPGHKHKKRIPLFRKPLIQPLDKCEKDKDDIKKASAIVAQVLVHFGQGYGPTGAQIFATPSDLAVFHRLLLKSTLKNLATLNWDTDQPTRDTVCNAAFQHGILAKTAAGGAPLTIGVIMTTLQTVQTNICPPGAGGGPVCDF